MLLYRLNFIFIRHQLTYQLSYLF